MEIISYDKFRAKFSGYILTGKILGYPYYPLIIQAFRLKPRAYCPGVQHIIKKGRPCRQVYDFGTDIACKYNIDYRLQIQEQRK